jgi:glucan phosphoethanolaminetransferase (alkaline phosphatase superfamily)
MQMNKYLVFAILLFFLVYTVAGIFINIPKNINNFLMILVSIGAIYFIIFKTDFRENFKKNMKEKSEEIKRSKAEKVK